MLDPMRNLLNSAEEGSRRFSFFKGRQVPGPFLSFSLHEHFQILFSFFSILHFHTFVPRHSRTRASKKRQKSQKSITNRSVNLAWKSYLQKGPPKCENRIPFKRFKSISEVPRYPKKAPEMDSKWTPKL